MKFRLTLRNSVPAAGQPAELKLELAEGEQCVIGRGSFADLVCFTGACSRRHCVIEVSGGVLLLSDLGSSGGTWLDSKKIFRRAPFGAGAVINAGQARIDVLAVETIL